MSEQFNKGKQLIVAIILGILTYWLFAQSFLNIAPHVQRFYDVDMSIVNILNWCVYSCSRRFI